MPNASRKTAWILVVLATSGLGLALAVPALRQERAVEHTLRNIHADPGAGLRASEVERMTQAWFFETKQPMTHGPLARDGRIYIADWSGTVAALDASSGKPLWSRTIEEPKTAWPWHGFVGTGALGDGLLFEASMEGTAFAIDLKTGEVRWKTRIAQDPQAGSICDLLHHDGRLYVGLTSVEEMLDAKKEGFEPDFKGKILALEGSSGKPVWELALALPPHNGATMWSSFALDPESGLLYFTTSNNYTGEANELSDALVAVDAGTGKIRWARQFTQHDVWTKENPVGPDYAFGAGPQLFEATVAGQRRKVVGAGQKSGHFWAVDRATGELLWWTVVGYGGKGGGIHDESSIGHERILSWSNNGYVYGKPAEDFPLNIKALDPATGKPLWHRHHAQPASLSAGILAGEVYFVGSLDGKVRAYAAADGRPLWTSPAVGSVIAPLAYAEDLLLVGTGTPKLLGKAAHGKNGLAAFTPGKEAK